VLERFSKHLCFSPQLLMLCFCRLPQQGNVGGRFFSCFFRLPQQGNVGDHFFSCFFRLPQRGSVGDRFFSSGWQLSLMKRMKKRLTETADHYRQMAARCSAVTSSELEDHLPALISTREFCEKLEKFVFFNLACHVSV